MMYVVIYVENKFYLNKAVLKQWCIWEIVGKSKQQIKKPL